MTRKSRVPARRRSEIKRVGRRSVSTVRKMPFLERRARLPRQKKLRRSVSMSVRGFRGRITHAKVNGYSSIPLGNDNYISIKKAEMALGAMLYMMKLKDGQIVTFTPKSLTDPTVDDYIMTT